MKLEKESVKFTPTAEELSLPDQGPQKAAASYSDRVERKRMVDSIKGKGLPLGGAPPIPEGKMKGLVGLPQPDFGEPPDIGTPEVPDAPMNFPAEPVPGVGSTYSVNQAMARGDINRPISMKEAKEMGLGGQIKDEKKPLSEETVKALRETKKYMDGGETDSKLGEVEKEFVEDKQDDNLPFDFSELMRQQSKLISKDRKKTIEDRLTPLQIEDLIVHREIQQTIPIIPGKFELTLRTYSQSEHLWILQKLYEYVGSSQYIMELLDTFKLVLSVVAINGKALPDHRVNRGTMKEEVDKELFDRKLFHISSFPVHIIADMGVQTNWLHERVNRLFTYENVKNG